MDLAKLMVKLELEHAKYTADIEKVNRKLDRFAKNTSKSLAGISAAARNVNRALGALGVGVTLAAIGSLASKTLQAGDALNKASIKAGVSAEAISELAYAASLSGVELTGLSTSLRFMQKSLSEAATGGKEQVRALDALGLSVKELKALSPDRQFEVLGDRISKLKDPSDKARAAMVLLGRAGVDLLPLFEQGAEGVRKMREEAQKVGQSFSKEQLQKLTDAKDSVDRLGMSFGALATTLLSKVAPGLTRFFNDLAGVTPKVEKLRRELDALAEREQGYREMAKKQGFSPEQTEALLRGPRIRRETLEAELKAATAAPAAPGGAAPPGFASDAVVRQAKEWDKLLDDINKSTAKFADENLEILTGEFKDLSQEQGDFLGGWNERFQTYMDDLARYGEKTTEKFSAVADEAARSMEQAFADFLFDPFKGGLDGMLKGFVDTLRRMVAHAAAVQVFEQLGFVDGGVKGGFLGKMFGGLLGRASGGPVTAGRSYIVGERGPELFLPNRSGSIVPNEGLRSGDVVVNQHISGVGLTQEQLAVVLSRNNREMVRTLQQANSRSGLPVPVL